jgi:DNA invertase Pin-like site-specific DNA recombinase
MLKKAGDNDWSLEPRDIWDENVDDAGKVRKASGGAKLTDRPKLLAAVEAVEQGKAKVIVAERMDRFFRDLDVQREVIKRVEAAGGKIETLNGAISHATAEAELNANLNGAVNQYMRRTAMERSWAAVEVAIEQGKVPWSQTAPGYLRDENSRLTPDPKLAPVMVKAFEMRRKKATIWEVREFLRAHGIERSYHGTQHLFRDRIYVGEIHFGTHTPNLKAHKPIIKRSVFNAVAKLKDPRGPKVESPRLLARLGVLRCDTCGGRMVVGTQTQNGRSYAFYRCPHAGKGDDCSARMSIGATLIEDHLVSRAKDLLVGIRETVTEVSDAQQAAQALEDAQAALDAAVQAFVGLEVEPSVNKRLHELRDARDEARERYEAELDTEGAMSMVVGVKDWDQLTFDEQRELIRVLVPEVRVKRGRGLARVEIKPPTGLR